MLPCVMLMLIGILEPRACSTTHRFEFRPHSTHIRAPGDQQQAWHSDTNNATTLFPAATRTEARVTQMCSAPRRC